LTSAYAAAFPFRPGDGEEDGDQGHAVLDPIPPAAYHEPSLRGVDQRDAGGQLNRKEERQRDNESPESQQQGAASASSTANTPSVAPTCSES